MANVWLIAAASRGMGVEFAKAVLASGRSVVASGRSRERVLHGAIDELCRDVLTVATGTRTEVVLDAYGRRPKSTRASGAKNCVETV